MSNQRDAAFAVVPLGQSDVSLWLELWHGAQRNPECAEKNQRSANTGQAYSHKYEIITRQDRRRQHMMDEPGKRKHEGAEWRKARGYWCNTNSGWRDGSKRQNKRWMDGRTVEVWVSQASSITALLSSRLLFLPFKELKVDNVCLEAGCE